MRRVWGKIPLVSRQFFVGNVENAVLTFLTHSADAVLFHAQLVAEIVGRFAAAHASATRHRKGAGPPKDVEADVFEFCNHSFTFHGKKVSEKSFLVKRFFQIFFFKNFLDKAYGAWYNEATPPGGGGGVAQTVPTRYL